MSEKSELTIILPENSGFSENEKDRLKKHVTDSIDAYLEAKGIMHKESDKTVIDGQGLIKYICYDCMEEFILGKKAVEKNKNKVVCPFCGHSSNIDSLAECSAEDQEEMELGCLSVSYAETDNHRVHDRFKALELALYLERKRESGLTNQRKKELYDKFIIFGQDYYTFDEIVNKSNSTLQMN
jgi:DNA-directed RNA polymerase subunit RPC12/RpoP